MTTPDTSRLGGEHFAIVSPDDRKRMPLGRYMTREVTKGWRVYRSADGRQLFLEAIVDE